MLITLLESRIAPIIFSWSAIIRLTRPAARSPSRSSWCMRPRLAAVMEVSAAEISAESVSSRTTSTGARPASDGDDRSRECSFGDRGIRARPGRRRPWRRRRRRAPRARMKVSSPPSAFLSWPMWRDQARSASNGGRRNVGSKPRGQAGGGDGRLGPLRRPGRGTGPGRRRSGRRWPCRRPRPRRAAAPRRSRSRPPGRGRRCGRGSAGARRPGLLLVLGDDLGLHLDRAGDGAGQARPDRAARTAGPLASSHSKKAKSPSRPYLITSA